MPTMEIKERLNLIIDYHSIDRHGIPRPLFNISSELAKSQHATCSWSGEQRGIRPEILSQKTRVLPQCLTLLCFWTSTTLLTVEFDGRRRQTKRYANSVELGPQSFYFTDDLLIKHHRTDDVKFVALGSAENGSEEGHGDLFIMMTSEENGVCYRSSILTIHEREWIRLEQSWEVVIL